MVVSAEALAALGAIEHGARLNTIHTVARELIGAGLASDDWGHLGLTESGRVFLRKGRFTVPISADDTICDLSAHIFQNKHPIEIDPMAAPHLVGKKQAAPLILEEAPSPPLPIAENRMQEMLRAAGVASGITGVWVDVKWLEEFTRALDAE